MFFCLVSSLLSLPLMGTHMWTHFFSPAIKRRTFAPRPRAFFVSVYVRVYASGNLLDLCDIFRMFFSRTLVEKQVSSPQPAGLSLKLQETRQITDEAPAVLAF